MNDEKQIRKTLVYPIWVHEIIVKSALEDRRSTNMMLNKILTDWARKLRENKND